ncbi:MAG: helix-turn-helix transcriptional regulator [Clostridiaceae bacterium]|nr:helix-turn-helix transcriptional regulator [Clostridiaceae bacterium]
MFRKNTRQTFTEYLTNLRISYAGKLLRVSDLNVNEVAEKAGFKDYFYFTRVFKKVTGRTPSDYRTESEKS